MLTKEQWKQAPTWARWYVPETKEFLSERDLEREQRRYGYMTEAEPRPFDTYPCPFCGGTDLLAEQDFGFWRIECQTYSPLPCTSGPLGLTEEEAWEAWAKRV